MGIESAPWRRKGTKVVCSDCGHKDRMYPKQKHAAGRQRCPKCGGPMNLPSQAEAPSRNKP